MKKKRINWKINKKELIEKWIKRINWKINKKELMKNE
jgi:hypothetical protein